MKHFKTITTDNTVIMGRNTFLSLPNGALSNRKNVVISDDPNDTFEGCYMASSIDEAISITKDDGEVFIIGGASIYKQFLPLADKLYITYVDDEPIADTYFPEIDNNIWEVISKEDHYKDENHCVDYSFLVFERKK
jgi:dihydrofolate reductase